MLAVYVRIHFCIKINVSNDAGSLEIVDFFCFSLSSFLFFDRSKGFQSKESGTQALSEIFSHTSPASKCALRAGCCVLIEQKPGSSNIQLTRSSSTS